MSLFRIFLPFVSILLFINCQPQKTSNAVINTDIANFWNAYDSIITTTDSTLQYQYLQQLFLEKGTPGLKAFMERKRYTPASYIQAINSYPKFWASVRKNTFKTDRFAAEIENEIGKLKSLYPDLEPAKIYFTIGALMSGGTTLDSFVLIGSEIAMADSSAVTEEFPDWLKGSLRPFFDSNPIHDVVLLNIHEYVHTQQRPQGGYDLLSQCLYEGVAEFVSVKSTGQPSTTPAIAYGKANEDRIKERFAQELFSPNFDYWLYNSFNNEFEMRDLGYYVGYAICEKRYEQANDKQQAIKEMIELDYGDAEAVEEYVEHSVYFSIPLEELKATYQKNRPEVTGIKEFDNGSQMVDPSITQLTIQFSKPMNDQIGRFEFGPLGEAYGLPLRGFAGSSEDGTAFTYNVELEPGKRYQQQLTPVFRAREGHALRPFLIDFKTRND